MSPRKPKFYLTTPIYYTNGLPHIGHTYTTVVADTIRRYKRMRGYEVVMTTGTDEHGVNVERAAKKAVISETAFVAKMAAEWRGDQGYGFFIVLREGGELIGGVNLSHVRRGVAQTAGLNYRARIEAGV